MQNACYTSRKPQLLKSFSGSIALSRQMLVSAYGEQEARRIADDCLLEYESIIPQIPFIGKRSPFLLFLIPTSQYLAVYRVLLRHGLKTEDAARIICRMNEAQWRAIPFFVSKTIGCLWFSPLFKWRLKKRAAQSQTRKYQEDYVLTFIHGDGQTFDYGVDYTECAGCTFLRRQGAPELAPLMCYFDEAASKTLGWGLSRTTTLAEGHAVCNFRFKKGGPTHVGLPVILQAVKNP